MAAAKKSLFSVFNISKKTSTPNNKLQASTAAAAAGPNKVRPTEEETGPMDADPNIDSKTTKFIAEFHREMRTKWHTIHL